MDNRTSFFQAQCIGCCFGQQSLDNVWGSSLLHITFLQESLTEQLAGALSIRLDYGCAKLDCGRWLVILYVYT